MTQPYEAAAADPALSDHLARQIPGWMAERMAQQLTQHLQCELLRQTRDRALQKAAVEGPTTLLNRRKADQHGH